MEQKKIDNSTIEKLLRENIELNQKIYESCQKTEKYIFFVKAFNIFKFILVLIPVVIGILYLIPIVGDFIEMYRGFFTAAGETTGILDVLEGTKEL